MEKPIGYATTLTITGLLCNSSCPCRRTSFSDSSVSTAVGLPHYAINPYLSTLPESSDKPTHNGPACTYYWSPSTPIGLERNENAPAPSCTYAIYSTHSADGVSLIDYLLDIFRMNSG